MKCRLWALLVAMTILASWLILANAETVESGSCGEGVLWELNSNGTMTISGTGAMDNFENSVPWEHLKDLILSVVIEDGVTGIGDNAFSNCKQLSTVLCPNSLASIGSYAFSYCASLKSIVFPRHLDHLGEGAFLWCRNFYIMYFQDD